MVGQSKVGTWVKFASAPTTAIRGYTINGAYANFVDTNRGSLTAGKYADLVLLSDDLFRIVPDRIKDARVVLTVVGGQEIYRHASAGATD